MQGSKQEVTKFVSFVETGGEIYQVHAVPLNKKTEPYLQEILLQSYPFDLVVMTTLWAENKNLLGIN